MHGNGVLPLVGSHEGMSKYKTILDRIVATNSKTDRKALQIFNGNKYSYGRNKLTSDEMRSILDYTDKNLIRVFCHCPYVINLAKDVTKESKNFSAMKGDVYNMAPAGIASVCHIGHHLNEYSINSVCETMSNLEFREDFTECPILLENAAGDGTELGVTWDELNYLAQNTDPNIGFCIDTQHLFATGQLHDEINLWSVDGVNELFKKLERTFGGLNRLRLFHLNDSKYNPKDIPLSKKYCNRKDSHANISCGFIWGMDKSHLSGLRHLLLRGGELNIPFITETKPKPKNMLQDPEVVYKFLIDGE